MMRDEFKRQERNVTAKQDADAYASEHRQTETDSSFMMNRRKTVFWALVILGIIVIAFVTNLQNYPRQTHWRRLPYLIDNTEDELKFSCILKRKTGTVLPVPAKTQDFYFFFMAIYIDQKSKFIICCNSWGILPQNNSELFRMNSL